MREEVLLFVLAAAVIVVAGAIMSKTADRLADRTGLGEALAGVLLLAAATSIPDFAATLSAALDDRPQLAMNNITGSMAANFVFLSIADAFYRKANLEHAVASDANLMRAVLFITLLSLPLIAMVAPEIAMWGVHPATPLIVIVYVLGLRLVNRVREAPMWSPKLTPQTVKDVPDEENVKASLPRLWTKFIAATAVTGLAGWLIMDAAASLVDETGLSEAIAGGVFTAIATSLPELVTTVSAVRHGALALAYGNIVGTNFFNVVVIAAADAAYRPGSIYHAISTAQLGWGLLVILMTAVLLLGMIRRQTYGIARMGFESVLILVLYAAGVFMMIYW